VRYADDCTVYVRSTRAGERVMALLRRLFAELRLRVNEAKSAVARVGSRKFLGFSFWVAPGRKIQPRVVGKALAAMKERVRRLTRRNCGQSLEQVVADLRPYLLGSRAYFGMGATPRVFRELDEWIRHRLRTIQLKQSTRGRTAYRELTAPRRPLRWPPTPAAGGGTARWRFITPFRTACSTSLACPGSPRNLNLSDRPVRTRMPGGVGGDRRGSPAAPIPIQGAGKAGKLRMPVPSALAPEKKSVSPPTAMPTALENETMSAWVLPSAAMASRMPPWVIA
jgi:hypothetical protein